jgi:NitT/TauT family transport system substrate-binding protein
MRALAQFLVSSVVFLLPAHALAFTIIVTEPGTPLVPNSVIELAQRLGYFAREGVDVTFKRVGGTPMAIAALSAGEGDMANVSLQSLLAITARGETRFRAVASPAKSFSYVIATRDTINSLPELRGRLFGIGARGTLDDTLARAVLRKKGIDPTDLRIVGIGSPQVRLKALVAGKIDATTVSYGSWTALPDKTGLRILVTKDDFFRAAPVVAKVDVVTEKALRDKRDDIVKVTAAIVRLARDFARRPQRWAEVMAKVRPDVPVAELSALAQAYARDWCVDGCFEAGELTRSAELLYAGPAFKGTEAPPLARWADFSVLSSVLGDLGGSRSADRAER